MPSARLWLNGDVAPLSVRGLLKTTGNPNMPGEPLGQALARGCRAAFDPGALGWR